MNVKMKRKENERREKATKTKPQKLTKPIRMKESEIE